jgi:hypothetical protein
VKKFILFLSVLAFVCSFATSTHALEFDYNYAYTGTSPSGPAPWLNVTFENMGTSTQGKKIVRITFEALHLKPGEFVTDWYFNINPSIDLTKLSYSQLYGPEATFSFGQDQYKSPGDGKYDMKVSFSSSQNGRFGSDGDASFQIESPDTSFGMASFNFSSTPDTGDGKSYLSAAHVQGLAYGEGSGVVVPIKLVPEPGTMLLLGLGLIGIGIVIRELF